jgi:transposase
MRSGRELFPKITVGLDLGDRVSEVCEVDWRGREVRRGRVVTTRAGMRQYFGRRERCRVVLEAGTHSPWVSRELEALGHEVVVGDPSGLFGGRWKKKSDRLDARYLARQGRADVELVYPIRHRGEEAQRDLALIRARDQVVRTRTKLINHVRGAVKSVGGRIGRCSAEAFARRARSELPQELCEALLPLVELIEQLTVQIRAYDRQVERLVERYPEAVRLKRIVGVGSLTAVAYVLLVEDARRFGRSRQVGAYFGLVPRLAESGGAEPQLRISKAGDELGRRLLISAAHYILGPHGPECDLRRYGERICGRGGKNAKKRAVVAVARKLAVLLHRLWLSEALYDPDHQLRRRERRQLQLA